MITSSEAEQLKLSNIVYMDFKSTFIARVENKKFKMTD